MDSDYEYSDQEVPNYKSFHISLTPRIEPQESTTLFKTDNGRPKIKPFIISIAIIIFILFGIIGTILIKQHYNETSLLNDIDESGQQHTSFINQDANNNNNNNNNNGGCSNTDIDCNGHGTCNYYTSSCKCDIGYTTHNSLDGTECNYKQKYQMNAFLLSLFLGEFGAGRFYVGDYVLGTIKLLLIFIGCCIACIAMMTGAGTESGACMILGYCVLFCSACGLGVWCFVDIILFAINLIPDENGVQLSPW